jgi:hypothetical protein
VFSGLEIHAVEKIGESRIPVQRAANEYGPTCVLAFGQRAIALVQLY